MSRLVPVHNPHPGGTYIWFTVPDEPGPEMERTVTTAPGPQAGTENEPVPYSLTPAAEAALPGTREIEEAFRSAEENYFRSPGTAGRLLADCEIDGPEAAYELAAEVLDERDSAGSAAYQDRLEAEGAEPEPEAGP